MGGLTEADTLLILSAPGSVVALWVYLGTVKQEIKQLHKRLVRLENFIMFGRSEPHAD